MSSNCGLSVNYGYKQIIYSLASNDETIEKVVYDKKPRIDIISIWIESKGELKHMNVYLIPIFVINIICRTTYYIPFF